MTVPIALLYTHHYGVESSWTMWDVIVQFGRQQHINVLYSHSIPASVSPSVSLTLLLSVCLSVCFSVCLYLCLSIPLSLTHSSCLSSLPLSPSLSLSPLTPGFSENLQTLKSPSSVRSGGECVSQMLKLKVAVQDGEYTASRDSCT